MKILHISLHEKIPAGVLLQVGYEYETAKYLTDVKWDNIMFTLDETRRDWVKPVRSPVNNKIIRYLALRLAAFRWLKRNAGQYDIILLRYSVGDVIQYIYSFFIKTLYTVHHTFEVDECMMNPGKLAFIKTIIERNIGKKVINKVKAIVAVTGEIAEYEQKRVKSQKKIIIYPNGILCKINSVVDDQRAGKIKFIVVASSFVPWHGLDLLIDSFLDKKVQCELHVVGHVPEKELLKGHSSNEIFFHGVQNKNYISELLKKMDLGLSSFALYRKGMTEACTLKVREYLAAGVPVYAGHRDSGLPDYFPYYRKGEAVIEKMHEFAVMMRNIDRDKVRKEATPYIDKSLLMKNLILDLRKIQ